jgi:hypothetical protein
VDIGDQVHRGPRTCEPHSQHRADGERRQQRDGHAKLGHDFSITTTGCASGETLFLRIGRDPTNGSDTLAATAVLLEFEVTLRRAQ